MSWFSRKNESPALLEDAIKLAKAEVSTHLHSLPLDVLEHVTEYTDGRKDRRNDTWGHHDMRRWISKLKELRARVAHLEQAEEKRNRIAQHLGVSASKLDMDGLLRLLHEADTHAASESETPNA